MTQVFSYWKGSQTKYSEQFIMGWKSAFPSFRIYDEDDVVKTLREEFPEFVNIFRSIQIPSPQSDVCRYLMLYLHGGLYIDTHFGFDRQDEIVAFIQDVEDRELVAIENALFRDRRPSDHFLLISGFLKAKPRHPAILDALRFCMANLEKQWVDEQRNEFVQYDIWKLCGPWVLNLALFNNVHMDDSDPRVYVNPENPKPALKDKYANALIVREKDLPAKRNRYKSYYAAGMHWSERQNSERLFKPALAVADFSS